ncbi:phage head-tail joining protein [Paraburkholderia caribensis]|uniref:phage head-tail joining protein n=1 Tax=Paraburkholderia caribensis TaxID=75105 RepID=UPI000720B569|nr:hypothetical protein [Paraburkholderia caribensis]ALP62815.1 hypothetical protein AN416_09550 [Paraburkholderia caribensis]AUT51954.1 hypothetical protein C2L66_08850 [Paraburkholderia caribensis]
MAFTQQNLDAIEKAIATGTLSVEFNGKRVTYRSMSDLLKARDVIKSELASQSATRAPRSSVAIYKRF